MVKFIIANRYYQLEFKMLNYELETLTPNDDLQHSNSYMLTLICQLDYFNLWTTALQLLLLELY